MLAPEHFGDIVSETNDRYALRLAEKRNIEDCDRFLELADCASWGTLYDPMIPIYGNKEHSLEVAKGMYVEEWSCLSYNTAIFVEVVDSKKICGMASMFDASYFEEMFTPLLPGSPVGIAAGSGASPLLVISRDEERLIRDAINDAGSGGAIFCPYLAVYNNRVGGQVANMLICALVDVLVASKKGGLYLAVLEKNRASALYRRLGFKDMGISCAEGDHNMLLYKVDMKTGKAKQALRVHGGDKLCNFLGI